MSYATALMMKRLRPDSVFLSEIWMCGKQAKARNAAAGEEKDLRVAKKRRMKPASGKAFNRGWSRSRFQ
jgi:hypothetical protein